MGTGEETPCDGANRRRSLRVAVNIEVDYAADSTFLYAYITDISSMGIFIRTDTPSTPGTSLSLRFTPPSDTDEPAEIIVIDGEVKWTSKHADTGGPGMGIEFILTDQAMRKRLLDLVFAIAYLTPNTDADASGSQGPSAAS